MKVCTAKAYLQTTSEIHMLTPRNIVFHKIRPLCILMYVNGCQLNELQAGSGSPGMH